MDTDYSGRTFSAERKLAPAGGPAAWGPSVDQLLADETIDATPGEAEDVLWALSDHLGSVRGLARYDADTNTTAVANHMVFDAFGRKTSETDAAVDCLFGFTGKFFDETSGLSGTAP